MYTQCCKKLLIMHKNWGRLLACGRNSADRIWTHSCPIDVVGGNDLVRQQRMANIASSKSDQNGHYRKECPSLSNTIPVLDQTLSTPMYSLCTTVTYMVTASYAVLQSSLVTIYKKIAKAKHMNWHLSSNVQQAPPDQSFIPQPSVTKEMVASKVDTPMIPAIGKETVKFVQKYTKSSSTKTMTSYKTEIYCGYYLCWRGQRSSLVTEHNEVTLNKDEIGNFFQDTSSEEELGTEWLQAHLQALQEEPSSL